MIELSLHGLADAGKTVLKTGVSTVTTVVKNPCCCLPSVVEKKKQKLDCIIIYNTLFIYFIIIYIVTKHASEPQRYQKLTSKYEERSEIIYNIIRRLYDVDFPVDSWSGNESIILLYIFINCFFIVYFILFCFVIFITLLYLLI